MADFPSKDAILQWIEDNPEATRREIARAFGIRGAAKIDFKALLKEMEDEGVPVRRHQRDRVESGLPPVTVIEITGPDRGGDLLARPVDWRGDDPPPVIRVQPREMDQGLGPRDRLLARIDETPGDDHPYLARPIRRIAAAPARVLGIFKRDSHGGRILPIDKGEAQQWVVGPGNDNGAQDGELVEAEQVGPKGRLGLPKARVTEVLGDPAGPRAVSLIAIHQHGIPDVFPDKVLDEAEQAEPAGLEGREDLRHLDLLTIDPEDARDRDDAVLAIPDDTPGNDGGFVLWVAIADVAYYVRPQSHLDTEARIRGNSTYFPDRVVPMLPDRLSGDLCSLHEGVDRAVVAVRMRIDREGRKLDHSFTRGLMRSRASLAYGHVQDAIDGRPNERTEPLLETVLKPLYAAYEALRRAREVRAPLDLDLPERRIELSPEGKVLSVAFKDRLDAHRLIEEFMVLANVAAAETLVQNRTPLLFRVHEEPDPLKLESLRETVEASGLTLARGQVLQTRHLNRLLAQAAGTDQAELINMATLRSLPQAYYAPENFGHFGLALRNYAHFTSPIRRYADLIVHRALISAHRWGPDPKADGLSDPDIDRIAETGELISNAERRSMMAERDTADRYLAAFLADRVGTELSGRIAGVAKFGLFVKLDESGADGLVPVRSLGDEYFRFDAREGTLTGGDSGVVFALGSRVTVKLAEVSPVTGGIILELLTLEDHPLPRGRGRGAKRGAPPRRKLGQERAREAKERKVSRRRK
ncbi:MAG: 3'-to-5' exoribonuclease RNase R [uncultured Rubellimicrobium sp.]|uniref:Ribonuclease R n=1 Tax=uncultured Rubellimicrobium sp. TaxID=543078 RepID=A0A6J4NVQ0_9RHOB|nr:MAG: 3'-to-5' exoribonuclease RNase R [uncultured Rubellimicrobium sp.]